LSHRRVPIFVPAVFVLAVTVLACDAAPTATGCEDMLSPSNWIETGPLELVELWRAGGTNEGEGLALPISVDVGPDGQVAISDLQLGLIGVGRDGEWRDDLVRKGEGPGEVAMPLAAVWTPEGYLGVFDFGRARAVFVDSSQDLIREHALDPTSLAAAAASGQIAGISLAPDGSGWLQANETDDATGWVLQTLLRVGPDGDSADTLGRVTSPALAGLGPGSTVLAPGHPRLVFDASPDGRIAVAGESADYEVRITNAEGAVHVVCRRAEGLPLRPDETGDEIGDVDPEHPFVEPIRSATRPDRPAPIGRVFFGQDGRLWVERDRMSPFNGFGALYGQRGSKFDVFDREGGYLGEVQAPPDAYLMAASDSRIWAFEIGPLDETWLVAYRLSRRDPPRLELLAPPGG